MKSFKLSLLTQAIVVLILLVVLLIFTSSVFGDASIEGPFQIVMLFVASFTAVLAMFFSKKQISWERIEQGVKDSIATASMPIVILLLVGMTIGVLVTSGSVPTLMYYGMILISPDWFYVCALIACALVSISIGSSWTTAATVGVSFVGASALAELSVPMTAGAVIGGAYFGDKLSPLSDTTNLSSAVAGANLFKHIRHMTVTTVPSFIIAAVLFTFFGFLETTEVDVSELEEATLALAQFWEPSIFQLAPIILLIALAVMRVPAMLTLVFCSLFAMVQIFIFYDARMPNQEPLLYELFSLLISGSEIASGNEQLDEIFSRGGMVSMLNTIWLILCAMTMGGVLTTTGILHELVERIVQACKSAWSYSGAIVFSGVTNNILSAEQYIAISLTGSMYAKSFAQKNLRKEDLSRVTEDSVTVTSALVPWNSCGAFMAATLGVATIDYLPFAFFNLLCPIIGWIVLYKVIKIRTVQVRTDSALEQ